MRDKDTEGVTKEDIYGFGICFLISIAFGIFVIATIQSCNP